MAQAFDVYEEQLAAASRSFIKIQQPDGGWGLTPTSVSSIVNTAEAVVVLRASGAGQKQAARGLDFLVEALPVFYAPPPERPGMPGGRGERIRHLSFFLDGLLSYPDRAFADDGLGAIVFALERLRIATLQGGWPESHMGKRISIHQTARVVAALSRLLVLDNEAHRLSAAQRDLTRSMADGGAVALVKLQRQADGSWPERPGVEEVSSPTKTSLSVMALAYYSYLRRDPKIDHARAEGARWLIEHQDYWLRRTEDDTDEQGTHWVHLAYAECVRGVVAGFTEVPTQLSRSWKVMQKLWSDDEFLWVEPSLTVGKATIRAAYHTVMAFESAKDNSRLLLPPKLASNEPDSLGTLQRLELDPNRNGTIVVVAANGSTVLELPPALLKTATAFIRHGNDSTTAQLADTAGQKPNSVHQYIGRINKRIVGGTRGRVDGEIRSRPLPNGQWAYRIEADTTSG